MEQSAKALHLADKIASLLHNPFTLEDGMVKVSASVGTTLYQAEVHRDASTFITSAERAMQVQKQKHKQLSAGNGSRVAPA